MLCVNMVLRIVFASLNLPNNQFSFSLEDPCMHLHVHSNHLLVTKPMHGEKRPLVTDEPVEFDK